jgi:hypothetical protein
MRRRIIAFTIAVIGLTFISAGPPASATPPSPSFDPVSCTVGGDTVVSWKHAHVNSLDLVWYNSAGGQVAIGEAQPNGVKFSTTTPPGVDVGGRVEVNVSLNDGTGAKLRPASCS